MVFIIKYKADKLTLTKPFSNPIFDTLTPAKLDAFNKPCAYIITTSMVDLEILDIHTLPVDNGLEWDQSEEEYFTAKNMRDPPRIDSIPEGEPSAIGDGSSNIDEDVSESHHSKINQDNETLILSLLNAHKEEETADSKIQLHVDLDTGLTKSSKECLTKLNAATTHQ